jgi:DNA-binding winged helix-turn-helix (wHTH) protein/tetratricopeptide (TPR) repeat protein
MPMADCARFRFAQFVLVPSERLLLRDQEPVPLTGKAFDLLLVLVRRSGHLVSKDELLQAVWPGRLVEEVNLSVNISTVRKVLGPAGFIQTVSKHGYRFTALVESLDAVTPAAVTSGIGTSSPAPLAGASPLAPGPGAAHAASADPDAYRAYLEGRYAWSQRSEASLRQAIDSFQRAVSLDPAFAAAHAGLADCHATLGYLSFVSPADAFPLARRHALLAIERDARLAESHASIGYVRFYFDWDWPGAETAFRRAITLDPGWAAAHQWCSIFLLAAGRAGEAAHEIELARERDPLSLAINTDLGFHYYYTGRYEEAIKQLRSVLAMNRDFAPAHLWLGRSYQQVGRFDDALDEFSRVEQSVPEWPVAIAARGSVEGAAGRRERAEATIAELQDLAGRRFVTAYGVALVHAAIGDAEAAFTWLDRAFAERSHWLVWLRLDPRFDGLRADPRMSELLRRIGFPEGVDLSPALPAHPIGGSPGLPLKR